MSSLPTFSADSLSEFSAVNGSRKKITDAFNQVYKELVDSPMDAYNIDVDSPSIPISFLYDLSNDHNTRHSHSNNVLLRTASSSDLTNFNSIDEFPYDDMEKRSGEFAQMMPAMPTERSLSAPCIVNINERNTDECDQVQGQITLSDIHILSQLSSHNQPPATTIFNNQYKYEFILNAPISIAQKKGDDTLTYLNKRQYYSIKFLSNPNTVDRVDFNRKIKSIIHLVFRNQDRKKEYEFWNYWYSQQPNSNIRVFDVDERSCKNIIIEKINEIGCNAVSFTWDSNISAEIVLRINCLSTEFSSQKGVKGTPLYIQVDTFEDTESLNPEPADRCYCQIKVFRDKGAERKNKDESRTTERKLQRLLKNGKLPSPTADIPTDTLSVFHKPCQHTILTKTTVLSPKPVIFTAPVRNLSINVGAPDDVLATDQKYYSHYHITSPVFSPPQQNLVGSVGSMGSTSSDQSDLSWNSSPSQEHHHSLFTLLRERESKRTLSQALTAANEGAQHMTIAGSADHDPSNNMNRPNKCARLQRPIPVTVYVKKTDEKIYNALCLSKLSLEALRDEVTAKYAIPKNMIAKLYKRTKKGLLIHMDNRMVEQFQDEDDFCIEISFHNKDGIFEVTFIY